MASGQEGAARQDGAFDVGAIRCASFDGSAIETFRLRTQPIVLRKGFLQIDANPCSAVSRPFDSLRGPLAHAARVSGDVAETFDDRIVEAGSTAALAGGQSVPVKVVLPLITAEPGALVRLSKGLVSEFAPPDGHKLCLQQQVGVGAPWQTTTRWRECPELCVSGRVHAGFRDGH